MGAFLSWMLGAGIERVPTNNELPIWTKIIDMEGVLARFRCRQAHTHKISLNTDIFDNYI